MADDALKAGYCPTLAIQIVTIIIKLRKEKATSLFAEIP
jgi:hypothetical protein